MYIKSPSGSTPYSINVTKAPKSVPCGLSASAAAIISAT